MGCFRSVEEIMQWGGADDVVKEQILKQADLRKQRRMENNKLTSEHNS